MKWPNCLFIQVLICRVNMSYCTFHIITLWLWFLVFSYKVTLRKRFKMGFCVWQQHHWRSIAVKWTPCPKVIEATEILRWKAKENRPGHFNRTKANQHLKSANCHIVNTVVWERAYVPTALCSHISLAPLDPASLEPQHLVRIELGLALILTLTLSAMLFTKYWRKSTH